MHDYDTAIGERGFVVADDGPSMVLLLVVGHDVAAAGAE
jgi:hypothetical protein